MEDYKEKYEMALERAKKNYDAAQDLCNGSQIGVECFKNTLTNIFPELKESEDEKMRKTIIDFVNEYGDKFFSTLAKGNAIAWLEKQGEQKPILDFKASNWYVSKVDGKIHDITYNPTDKVEPKFKVKYAGSEYNVFETKNIAGVPFYGIEDEPNHIDYVQADNCEIISGYAIKENGSSYPTNPAVFSEQKPFDYEKATITQKDFASVGETATIELSSPIDCGDRIYHVSHKPIEENGEQNQEWSGEDDAYKELAICAVANFYDDENPLQKCIVNWLKSLKDKIKEN